MTHLQWCWKAVASSSVISESCPGWRFWGWLTLVLQYCCGDVFNSGPSSLCHLCSETLGKPLPSWSVRQKNWWSTSWRFFTLVKRPHCPLLVVVAGTRTTLPSWDAVMEGPLPPTPGSKGSCRWGRKVGVQGVQSTCKERGPDLCKCCPLPSWGDAIQCGVRMAKPDTRLEPVATRGPEAIAFGWASPSWCYSSLGLWHIVRLRFLWGWSSGDVIKASEAQLIG